MERHGSPIRRARLISPIAAWWLWGLREKGQMDMAEVWRLVDIQTPSMGHLSSRLPCLKVIGGRRVGWAERIDSWRPRLIPKEEISSFWISLFISAIRIMLLPSACQVEIARPRSQKKAFLGW